MRIVQGATDIKQRIIGAVSIPLDDYSGPADISDVTGIKPMICVNDDAPFEGDLDIIKKSPMHYLIVASTTEAAEFAVGDLVFGFVPAGDGYAESTHTAVALVFEAEITGQPAGSIGLTEGAIEAVGDHVVPRSFRAHHYADGFGVERVDTAPKKMILTIPDAAPVEVLTETASERPTITKAGAAVS